MRLVRLFLLALAGGAVGAALPTDGRARDFTVMAYNVEMLFDVDGVALLEDYQPPAWNPAQLDRKLAGISAVVRSVAGGRGPDIICFNEFEADQTPDSAASDLTAFPARWAGTPASTLLAAPTLAPELADLPVQTWLAKRLADDGLAPYRVVVGRWRPDPTERVVFHTNAVFSRFPIVASQTHDTDGARGILEVLLDVEGHPLHVFVNHWKSGASDPVTEPVRCGNAGVLRRRLDEILRADPHADVILGGDLNSQYNQRQRYPQMTRTAVNDVLGSQGDELALRDTGGADLYNLWFELPVDRRGSDVWRDEWGTLMHLLITRGLYDFRDVQYVDNSFTVLTVPGLTTDRRSGLPQRWQFAGGPGISDHLPIVATFRTVNDAASTKWLALTNPSRTATGPAEGVPVKLPLDSATDLAAWPAEQELRNAENVGRYFKVRGQVLSTRPFRITTEGGRGEFAVFIHDPTVRADYFGKFSVGDAIAFTGELGQYRGEWQFVIPAEAAK